MNIGKQIKNKRLKAKLTQEELAEKININRSQIAQFERGSRLPNLALAKQMADVFGCKVDDLTA